MVPAINALNHFLPFRCSAQHLNSPTVSSLAVIINLRRRVHHSLAVSLNLAAKESFSFRSSYSLSYDILRPRCKGWERGGDLELEAEILEFMNKSEKPNVFPTKKELIDAGRMDLVKAILSHGGWLSLGWDSDEEEVSNDDINWSSDSVLARGVNNGSVVFEQRVDTVQEREYLESTEAESSRVPPNSYNSVSSSGRSLETGAENDTGVEGILRRLEEERNIIFGNGLSDKRNLAILLTDDAGENQRSQMSKVTDRVGLDRTRKIVPGSPSKGMLNSYSEGKLGPENPLSDFEGIGNSIQPDMWRTWSIRRAGSSNSEFEAAEISLNDSRIQETMDEQKDEVVATTEVGEEPLDRRKEMDFDGQEIKHNQIQTRLQHLEEELASVLHLLKSNSNVGLHEDHESSSEDLLKLSDAREFRENDIMSAQARLRATRAKLAVLQGKMSLSMMDAKRIVEEKQKKIDEAKRALSLLRTACVVWTNPASEVLLAGSFDGWTLQRRMERSNKGIFSLCLKLYPGRYEIKFIVDGTWRIDPLRPIVHSNGYENNLLIIT